MRAIQRENRCREHKALTIVYQNIKEEKKLGNLEGKRTRGRRVDRGVARGRVARGRVRGRAARIIGVDVQR